MSKYKVEISGINTSELKSLSNDEMMELFVKLQDGDLESRNKLIYGNMKLVLSILKRFNQSSENLDDLFQIGCVGLLKAIDNFDLSFGVKFSTYAVPMILGEVKRYIRDNNSVRISRSLKDIAYKVLNIREEYYLKNGREPSTSYLANNIGVSEYDISSAIMSLKDPISMYEPIYNDGGDTIYLYDQIEDKKKDPDLLESFALEEAIQELKEREQYILQERFVQGKSQMEISEELNISQAQVSRLEKKAIQGLKKVLK